MVTFFDVCLVNPEGRRWGLFRERVSYTSVRGSHFAAPRKRRVLAFMGELEMTKRLGCLVIALYLTACGGNSNGGPEASGGSATTGGTSSNTAGKSSGAGGTGGVMPPPSQGAATVTLKAVSPAPAGKSCPSGSVTSFAIPPVDSPNEALDAFTYRHWVIDGQAGAKVSCKVMASGSVSFEGTVQQAGSTLQISEGQLQADLHGTARITVADPQHLASALSSATDCVVNAARGDGNFQAQPGSMWASFSCGALEAAPSDSCAATGIFVLENCER
jgi:hypothetical protein